MSEMRINSGATEDSVHLLDYVLVLAKHSRMIIYASVTLALLTYLYLFISPNKYTATARLLPPRQNFALSAQLLENLGGGGPESTIGGGAAGALGGIAAGMLGLKSSGELYASIMIGNSISDLIIERFKLKKLYKSKFIDDARYELRKRVKIIVGKKDGLIDIEVTDENPIRAAEMANAYSEELDKLLQKLTLKEAKDRLNFLEGERVLATENLKKAEEALRRFGEQKSVIQLDTQTKSVLEYIGSLRASVDAKEIQLQVLRQQATPANYDVIRLETEIKGLKDKLRATENQWDQSCIGDVCLPTSTTPSLAIEYIRLYRETKYQEGLYQLFSKMTELARVDIVKKFGIINMVDKAFPPEKKSNKRLIPPILVGLLTLTFMAFFSFVLDSCHKLNLNDEDNHQLSLIKKYIEQLVHW